MRVTDPFVGFVNSEHLLFLALWCACCFGQWFLLWRISKRKGTDAASLVRNVCLSRPIACVTISFCLIWGMRTGMSLTTSTKLSSGSQSGQSTKLLSHTCTITFPTTSTWPGKCSSLKGEQRREKPPARPHTRYVLQVSYSKRCFH